MLQLLMTLRCFTTGVSVFFRDQGRKAGVNLHMQTEAGTYYIPQKQQKNIDANVYNHY